MCFQVDRFLYLDRSLALYSEQSKDCLKFFFTPKRKIFLSNFLGYFFAYFLRLNLSSLFHPLNYLHLVTNLLFKLISGMIVETVFHI